MLFRNMYNREKVKDIAVQDQGEPAGIVTVKLAHEGQETGELVVEEELFHGRVAAQVVDLTLSQVKIAQHNQI